MGVAGIELETSEMAEMDSQVFQEKGHQVVKACI